MTLRPIWILEHEPNRHGESLQSILEGAGGYRTTRLPWPEREPPVNRISSVDSPEAGFVLLPETASIGEYRGLLQRLELPTGVPWFLVGECGTPDEFLTAIHEGFSDFLLPPLRALDVLPRLLRQLEFQSATEPDIQSMKERLGLRHIVGKCPALLTELKKIPMMARCDAAVLIAGETGTGKEACARAIHYLGPRARNPFVAVNCGAIPADLIENELFGHDAGAYTGAMSSRRGLVEEASGGTLFLDEVDSLPLSAQVKLLRLLQEKEFRHLGSQKTCRADVRIVASANTDLESALQQRRFRTDLYYRLNVLPLRLPPLRERHEDLPQLARHFAVKYAREFGRPCRSLTPDALSRLAQHTWPGNVRELENVIERAVLLTDGPELRADDLGLSGPASTVQVRVTLREQKARMVREFEREYLTSLLARHAGNISRAAVEAGKNRRALFELIRRHRLNAREYAHPSASTNPEPLAQPHRRAASMGAPWSD